MSDLDNKFSSLGEKHKLEARKMQLLTEVTGLCNVNFSNVNETINPLNVVENDAVKQFRNWVKNNMARAATDEVVANIDSAVAMVEIVVDRYSYTKHLINQIRQLVIASANENLSEGQVQNLESEAQTLVSEISNTLSNASYNSISNIFGGSWKIQTSFIQNTSTINISFSDPSNVITNLINFIDLMTDTSVSVDTILNYVDIVQNLACNQESIGIGLHGELLSRRDAVIAEYLAVHRQLEQQRCEARKLINAELDYVLKSIEYNKIFICENPHC
jgi:hypothetical protein